jgi:dihydroxy-acid dehydratase
MSPAAFRNALRVAIALGGSVNCIRHLIATAGEAECPIDILRELDQLSGIVPLLARIRPNGPDRIEALDSAGGCRAVLRELQPLLELDALTVNGETLGSLLSRAPPKVGNVIRTLEAPASAEPGLTLIRGNLAPQGAIVKLAAVPTAIRRFRGVCRVFEDEDQAIAALGAHQIPNGAVIVLRMMGPIGGPGTVFAASFMAALVGAGLGSEVAVVTDGELSGLNSGLTVGQVMPEAAEGGPLVIVRDGDIIDIDLAARRITLELDASDIVSRLAAWDRRLPPAPRGWLGMYRSLVRPLAEGALLVPRERET